MKISRQVAIFGVILSFYKGQKWVKIFTNRSGQAEGGDPPIPPKAVSLTAFSQFFFNPSLSTYAKALLANNPKIGTAHEKESQEGAHRAHRLLHLLHVDLLLSPG